MIPYGYKNKYVGTLHDDLIFRKRVRGELHRMKINDSWGIQWDVLLDLKKQGCKEVRILDIDDNTVYSASLDTLMNKARVENFGDGLQAFLNLDLWKRRLKST
jgi:hypothetical protein